MISDPVELEELRKTTEDLIAYDGRDIALTRHGTERVPGGGVRPIAPVVQPAVRRFFGAVTDDARYITLTEGEQVITRHVLVGLIGDDIQEKDTFQIGIRKFLVVEVATETEWETRAWVVERS